MIRDRIKLHGMRFYGYHGVLAAEQELGQRFIVDVEMCLNLRPAGESDQLDRSVNYVAIYDEVHAVFDGPPCALIEAVAEQIATRIINASSAIDEVVVRVRKPEVPIAGILEDVEVEIVRSRP